MRDLHRLFEKPHSWWQNERCHLKLLNALRGGPRAAYKAAALGMTYGAPLKTVFAALRGDR